MILIMLQLSKIDLFMSHKIGNVSNMILTFYSFKQIIIECLKYASSVPGVRDQTPC